jgi:hypothetical protein
VLLGDRETFAGAETIVAIARGSYQDKPPAQIRSSGYVVYTLEAAISTEYPPTTLSRDRGATALERGRMGLGRRRPSRELQ